MTDLFDFLGLEEIKFSFVFWILGFSGFKSILCSMFANISFQWSPQSDFEGKILFLNELTPFNIM